MMLQDYLRNEDKRSNTIRACVVAFVALFCFTPTFYHAKGRIEHSNFYNLERVSYRTSVAIVVAMCCPMVLDILDRIYAGVEKRILNFNSLLLPFGLFIPNLLVLLFCFEPVRAALFYSIMLAQVCVLQGLLLVVLNLHDPVIWPDKVINGIMALRLTSLVSMVIYILVDVHLFSWIYFLALVIATFIFFWKAYLWIREHFTHIIHVLTSRQLQLFELDERELAHLYNAVVMVLLEISYLGFFTVPVNRVASYNFMCFVEVIAICFVTLFPGQLARRRAVLSHVRSIFLFISDWQLFFI